MPGIWNLEIRKTPIAVFDFETTGMCAGADRVVEASVVRIEPGGKINIAFDSLINPQCRIDFGATQVHGISERDIRYAPTFKEIASDFFHALSGCAIASYNIYFDMRFLHNEMKLLSMNHDLPHFCVMYLRSAICSCRTIKLGEACQKFGIALKNSHRALDDTRATAELLHRLLGSQRNVTTFQELAAIKKNYKFLKSFNHGLVPQNISEGLPKGGKLKSRSGWNPVTKPSHTCLRQHNMEQ